MLFAPPISLWTPRSEFWKFLRGPLAWSFAVRTVRIVASLAIAHQLIMLRDCLPFIRRDVLSFEHTPQPGGSLSLYRQHLLGFHCSKIAPDVHLIQFIKRPAGEPVQQDKIEHFGGYQPGFTGADPLNDTRRDTFPRFINSEHAVVNEAPTKPARRMSI